MLLNDVLRRLRFALSLDNAATIATFKLADYDLDEEYLSKMMLREDEQGFLPLRDKHQQDDMMRVLKTGGFPVGKSELTALFRKPDHRSYRVCQDQLLRNFLQGMVKTYRHDAR